MSYLMLTYVTGRDIFLPAGSGRKPKTALFNHRRNRAGKYVSVVSAKPEITGYGILIPGNRNIVRRPIINPGYFPDRPEAGIGAEYAKSIEELTGVIRPDRLISL